MCCARVNESKNGRNTHRERERERRRSKNAYLTHDECSDTHHGATTSQRVPQNRATMRPLVAIMLKCNLLITTAAPSRGLISPICTAVGERKQNGNERPVCLAGWFGIKRATLGMQKGRRTDRDGEIDREKERATARTMVAETGEIRKEINSAIDKRPVKRQSVPVWVDEALSILDKKHNRRYPGGYKARSLCLPFSNPHLFSFR